MGINLSFIFLMSSYIFSVAVFFSEMIVSFKKERYFKSGILFGLLAWATVSMGLVVIKWLW